MATVKDIAQASGVSSATVSYVLNNKLGEVSPETRERVMRAVRDLGYRPVPHSPRRRTSLTNNVGVLLAGRARNMVRQEGYFMEVLDGIISASANRHYATTIFPFEQWDDVYSSLRNQFDGRCDGLLFIGPPTENDIVPALFERGIPVVLICGDSTVPSVHRVSVDDVLGGRQATEYLISQGHRRIAHLMGDRIYQPAIARLRGYQDALAEAGLACDPRLVLSGGFHRSSGYERAMQLAHLPLSDRPTALYCANDVIALGALEALTSLGIPVPEEMSIIGTDDIFLASLSDPPLTTIRQPLAEIGYRAMEVLSTLLAHGPELPKEELLPTTLVIRGSVSTCKDAR